MALTDPFLLDPYPFETWIAFRTDGIKGSGTLNDPCDGSTQAGFDGIMNLLPANSRIHLGPGTFTTKGFSDELGASIGWEIKAGMSIVGSGMDVTTLKVTGADVVSGQYFAIGHKLRTGDPEVANPVDFGEVSDLTIDCNQANQLYGRIAAGAVRLMGNHVRVRRVKVINWGTTADKLCYVVQVITAEVIKGVQGFGRYEFTGVGIENCIAVEPSSANLGSVILFHAGANADPEDVEEAYGKSAFIRNCFVDCGLPLPEDPLLADIRALSMNWCRGGIVEGNQIHNTQIGGPYQEKATTRDIVVSKNVFRNVRRGPYWNLGSVCPTPPRQLGSLVREGQGETECTTAVATTLLDDHGLQIGDRVKIDAASAPEPYKGVFVVKEVPARNKFTYQMVRDPESDSTTNPTFQKVFGASNLLVERNLIELAVGSAGVIGIQVGDNELSQQTPDHVCGEAIIRGNRIRYLNGRFELSYSGSGIRLDGVKNAIITDNVVECAPDNPLQDFRCGTVKNSGNRTPSGPLVQGYDGIEQTQRSDLEGELENVAEEALVTSLI